MINEANEIERFFEALGLRIKLSKVPNKIRWGRQAYMLDLLSGSKILPHRQEALLSYYFENYDTHSDTQYYVILEKFDRDGHGDSEVCKRCGCWEMDACLDHDGRGCFWVEDNLCSECANPEQVEKAKLEFNSLLFKLRQQVNEKVSNQ